MSTTGAFLDIAILWLIIVIFTESFDSEQSFRDTWIVVFGVGLARLVFQFILGDSLRFLALPIECIALYYLVEWSCGTERKTTLKICGWYMVVGAAIKLAGYYLTRPGRLAGFHWSEHCGAVQGVAVHGFIGEEGLGGAECHLADQIHYTADRKNAEDFNPGKVIVNPSSAPFPSLRCKVLPKS